MTLKTFFEKFDQFADAPDAVARMRELILESAIRGKLVPRNASDEPASELLKRLASVQVGQVRKQPALPPVGDDAYLHVPPAWEWTRLGNTGRIFNGNSVSESGKAELAKVENGLPFIATKDVGYGRDLLLYDNGLKVPLGDLRFKAARADAVLICAEGGSAGRKIGIADRDICFGNKLFANEVREGIHHRYIFYVYQAPTFFKEFAAKMTGIIGGIARSAFLLLPIPLPPLAEQKRIVAKVDELMALCDRLEAQQQERQTRHAALARASLARFADAPTPANLQFLFHKSYAIPPADLRKSILTLAVQGKLVPFDTDGEDQTVGDHIEFQNGYAFKSEWFKPSGMRLCRNANVSHGVLDWRESAFVDDKVAMEFERFALSEGDIVLSLDRPLITTGLKVARVRQADLPCLLLQRVAKPVPKHDQLDLSYFLLWLNSSEFVDSIDPGRSNGVPHISTRQVQRLPFILPPLAEQRRIVAKVEQLVALVDALETQLAASRATAANLLSALVAELTNRS